MGSTAAAATFPTATRKAPRIPPDHLDRLTQAKYDMQALLRRDVTEQQILEMCLDDCLVSWIEQKLAGLRRGEQPEKPAPEKDRRRRGEKA